MRHWLVALAMLAALASTTAAGGMHASIEGPAKDGITYTARVQACDPNAKCEPWALAEGIVDGKRRSVLLRVEPTSEHGVYTFTRTWPSEGRWMVRFNLGHPPAPATVVTLRPDGGVANSKLYWKSDGARECHRALVPKGSKDDDC